MALRPLAGLTPVAPLARATSVTGLQGARARPFPKGTFHGGALGIPSHSIRRVGPVVRTVVPIRMSQPYESSFFF
jgi:hypothetical protein